MQIGCKVSNLDIGFRKLEFKFNFLHYQLVNDANSNKIHIIYDKKVDILKPI